MPFPRLKPLLLYLLHLIFYPLPGEGLGSFGVALPGVAVDFKIIQPYPLYPPLLIKERGKRF